MKCEACGHEISTSDELYTALGVVHDGQCPGEEAARQKYIEVQAKNMYTVWREAMNNSGSHMGFVMHTWEETMPEIKQVWYTVTAAALGMHKF